MAIHVIVLTVTLLLMTSSPVSPAEDFFKGKNVTLIVHYPPGGAYDRIPRVLAQPLREATGAANVIVQNKPGAVGETNFMYNEAKPDGLTLMITNVAVLAWTQLAEVKGVNYDMRKFQYIANVGPAWQMPLLRANIPYTDKAEELRRLPQLRLTGTTAGSLTSALISIFFENYNINGKILGGYRGSGDQMLAAERGEAEGSGFLSVATGTAEGKEYIDKGILRPMVVFAPQRVRQFPRTPTAFELGPWREDYMGWEMKLQAPFGVSHAFLAPPATPVELVQFLRQAFRKVLADPRVERELDAKVGRGLLEFMSGEEMQRTIPPMFDIPAETVKRVVSVMNKYER